MTTRVRVDVAAEDLWLTGVDNSSPLGIWSRCQLQVRILFPRDSRLDVLAIDPHHGIGDRPDLLSGFGWIAARTVARLIDWRWIQGCRPRPPRRRRRRRRGPRLRDGATMTGGGTRLVVLAGGRATRAQHQEIPPR